MLRRSATRVLIPTCLAICIQLAFAAEAAETAASNAPADTAATAQQDAAKPANDKDKSKDAAQMGTVEVRDQKQPYRNLSVTGATKTEAMIHDLPQNIQVLGADLLKDAGVTDLNHALDLDSSVAHQSNLGGLWDSYSMRGFSGDPNFGSAYMVNGFNASRGYNGVRDNADTQSIELLKGPSSALYGVGDPGGTINITTKKPLFQPEGSVEMQGGSFNDYRTAVDLTGPLTQSVAYRLDAAYSEGDSFRDTVHYQRTLITPSFLWMINPDTTLSYEIEAINQRAPYDRGIVAVNGKLGVVPISNFYGEPNDGDMQVKSVGHQLFFTHYFNENWSMQTGVTYRGSSLVGDATEVLPSGALIDGDILRRRYGYRDYEALDRSGRFEVLGKVMTGSFVNNLLFGVDAYRFNDGRLYNYVKPAGATYGINLFDPESDYGAPKPTMAPSIHTMEHDKNIGLYAQDQIDISEQWKALIGVRRDHFDQTFDNILLNSATMQSFGATSPRVGLVYEPIPNLSLYATMASSFYPNSGISRTYQTFAPQKGRSEEIGAKLDSFDNRLTTTLALYKIRKTNVLTPDPVDPQNFSIAQGEVQSRGVELDVNGQIIPGLRVSASYAYTDAKVTQDNSGLTGLSLVGQQLADVPKNAANLLLIKEFTLAGHAATFGGGVQYSGARQGEVAPVVETDLFTLPSYTVWSMLSSYQFSKQLSLSLDVQNLFNKTYYASSYSQYWVYPGTERRVMLTARLKL
jgi:iron complex outermembrane receptor protein